ncbi:MAG: glycosyl transferase, partial [Roseiflexaceae bacterium]|nr:glycosyl transferase [Roseiflexaceae bacterium]
ALLRLQRPASGGMLQLRLAAPHLGDAGAPATVCLANKCQTFAVARSWRTYTLPLPPAPANAPIEIRSPTFGGGDGRTLGLLIDQANVRGP